MPSISLHSPPAAPPALAPATPPSPHSHRQVLAVPCFGSILSMPVMMLFLLECGRCFLFPWPYQLIVVFEPLFDLGSGAFVVDLGFGEVRACGM